jgi:two-component system sensor histidine kinase PilS (NtrC family)
MTNASLINDWRWPVRLVVDGARVMAFPGGACTSAHSGSDPDSLSDSDTKLQSVWLDEGRPETPGTESLSKSSAWYKRIFSRAARESGASGQTAFQRIYRVFLGARLVLGFVLLASFVLAGVFVARPSVWISLITVGYAAQTLSAWLLHRPSENWGAKGIGLARLRWRDWFSTIGVDIVCYLSLHFLLANTVFNLLPFLVLPV